MNSKSVFMIIFEILKLAVELTMVIVKNKGKDDEKHEKATGLLQQTRLEIKKIK